VWSERGPLRYERLTWPEVRRAAAEERVPVLYRLPVGHAKHLATLPLGVTATLDADARTLTVDEPALR
jgi:muramoyltetrapeptide carboxypeptidase